MKVLIACLILLSTWVYTDAHAIIGPVNLDTGTVTDSSGSGTYCGITNSQLPGGRTQNSTVFTSGGVVSWGGDAYSYALNQDFTVVCTTVIWNITPNAFGGFAGSERVIMGGYLVTINVTGNYQYGSWPGALFPKYQVLGIDYAPPGANSSVTYGANFIRGTSETIGNTFKDETSWGVTLSSGKLDIKVVELETNANITSSYSQQTDTSSTKSISVQSRDGHTILGPASSTSGIDHDYDVVWIWLNPAVKITLTGPASVQWNGYAYNKADPANEMDVIWLYVRELKNPSLIPPNVASRLARIWDQSGVGGLTAQDYADILAQTSPFATNPAFDPNTDTSGRYSLQVGKTFNYKPAIAGGQPVTEDFQVTKQQSSSNTSGAEIASSVAMSIESKVTFLTKASATLKLTHTYGSVKKQSKSENEESGQTATLSITGPLASDNYTGPTAIQIWKDNIYGSFMFHATH